MPGVDLHSVEPGVATHPRGARKRLDYLADLGGSHRDADETAERARHVGWRPRQAAREPVHVMSAVPQLLEDSHAEGAHLLHEPLEATGTWTPRCGS